MPLKSWAFKIDDHVVRAEVWWRFTGWCRKRLYIDHRRVVGWRGWFGVRQPIRAKASECGPIEVRFSPRRFGFDTECEVVINGQSIDWEETHPAIEKRRSHSLSEEGADRRPSALGCFIVFPLLLVLWALSIPLGFVAVLYYAAGFQRRSERRFVKQMQNAKRFAEWPTLEDRIRSAPTTLIIQAGSSTPHRYWWTEEDVLSVSPLPIPPFFDAFSPGGGYSNEPFVVWCWHFYLSDQHGKALLTNPPATLLSQIDFYEDEECRARVTELYPLLKLIVVSYPRKEAVLISSSFAKAVGVDLQAAIPRLTQILQEDSDLLRRLALEAIHDSGASAAQAVHALANHFYFGPWSDQHWVAEALLAAGPPGLDFLASAAGWQDPVFRRQAQMALNRHAHLLAQPPQERIIRVRNRQVEQVKQRSSRLKIGTVLSILYWVASLSLCVICFLRYGILLGVACLFASLLLTMLISIAPHIFAMLWRLWKSKQKERNSPWQ